MALKPPAKVDAIGETIDFDFDGDTYTVPPASAWDLDAIEAFEADKMTTCVRLILGQAQYAKFKAKPRNVADLRNMFAALQTAVGTGN